MCEKTAETAKDFVKRKLPEALLHGFYLCVFTLIMYLYGAPLQGIGYAVIICVTSEMMVRVIQYLRLRQRHTEMEKAQRAAMLLPEVIPPPYGLIERDYVVFIDRLIREQAQLREKHARERREAADYYAVWVHQIKNPISAMRLLLQGEESDLSRALKAELFRVEQYVEMVLVYLRMGGDSGDYVIKKYALEPPVRQAVRKFSTVFITKKLSLDLGDLDCEVITDEKWLSFVIEQVLSNALKYTKVGTVSIRARQEEGRTELIVSDTGIGIAPEDLPRVFDKGFTGCNGRVDKRATGLGLYLSKGILDRLGHSIEIESQSGSGTVVTIGFSGDGHMVWD